MQKQTQKQGLYEEALEQFLQNKHKSKGCMRGALEQFLQTTTQPQVRWMRGNLFCLTEVLYGLPSPRRASLTIKDIDSEK